MRARSVEIKEEKDGESGRRRKKDDGDNDDDAVVEDKEIWMEERIEVEYDDEVRGEGWRRRRR